MKTRIVATPMMGMIIVMMMRTMRIAMIAQVMAMMMTVIFVMMIMSDVGHGHNIMMTMIVLRI